MTDILTFAPPYSMLFISDPDLGETPEPSGRHIDWTDSCISISCRYYHEGDTTVTLGPLAEVARFETPVVDRVIATPTREVVVITAELEVALRQRVATTRTRVRIWENHPSEPDDIVIGLG